MNRRQMIQVTGGGAIAAMLLTTTGCSSRLPANASVAWDEAREETDPRRWVLAHAILAPNSHNLQSWRVDLSEANTIQLYMDRNRLLPETDPFSRQMVMSQGTFLELLKIAAQEIGYLAEITPFPQGAFDSTGPDSRPVARIRLHEDASTDRDPLYGAIFSRHTNRAAYTDQAASARTLQAIIGARLGFFDRTQAPSPDSSVFRMQVRDFNAVIDATPMFFWTVTDDNSRFTQLEAGRAFVRMQLTATALGLSMHPLQQALQEYPEQKTNHQNIHQLCGALDSGQTVQMWGRLGYGPRAEPAPRRGLSEHII